MLPAIKRFFENNFVADNSATEVDSEHSLQLAMAALLVEVAESDFEDSPAEQDALIQIVKNSFQLDDHEAQELIKLAKVEHTESTDYFQFTSLINQNYSAEQRIGLIDKLWQIAFADNTLHKYEEHVIRRIADLIYVSHSDFMASKSRAMANNG